MAKAYVTITLKGKNPLAWVKEVDDKIHFEFQAKVADLGELTALRMQEIIKSSIKRAGSTGRLENSIDSTVLNSTGGVEVGIGDTARMPIYWEVINDGGYIPPANLGYFGEGKPPISGGNGEQWTHTGSKNDFLMVPRKPIEPVNYIGISARELKQHLINEIDKLYKSIDNISKV
jgi:hypothetical protein